ncbi:hypothetical protein K504DRAFT_45296 [Pleomassaria siparia CBS 279.74]|uniref:Uncharacterized protein n=1 Tax=Pleomassaria siparia CBS 279.74 TaxID=1314801 RepID=A0A6G1K5V3_9PLEO|nr:hypothetical protein K504DRAFT_45296 [Pleomassaria siparia CBS 279.74]
MPPWISLRGADATIAQSHRRFLQTLANDAYIWANGDLASRPRWLLICEPYFLEPFVAKTSSGLTSCNVVRDHSACTEQKNNNQTSLYLSPSQSLHTRRSSALSVSPYRFLRRTGAPRRGSGFGSDLQARGYRGSRMDDTTGSSVLPEDKSCEETLHEEVELDKISQPITRISFIQPIAVQQPQTHNLHNPYLISRRLSHI